MSFGLSLANSYEIVINETLDEWKINELINKQKNDLIRDDKKETVIDLKTKLMWQDNSEVIKNKRYWNDALKYCNDLTLDEYSDWRLPTRMELQSIVDRAKRDPAIKEGFKNVQTNNICYWSGSPTPAEKVSFIKACVSFMGGGVNFGYTSDNNLVRCVRDNR